MASQPIARLTRCGVLAIHQGNLRMSDAFTSHYRAHQRAGRTPGWDVLALLEQALASWGEYAGDARESARTLVRFLPQPYAAGLPNVPVLDAFIAA